jgi:hypothetical protein
MEKKFIIRPLTVPGTFRGYTLMKIMPVTILTSAADPVPEPDSAGSGIFWSDTDQDIWNRIRIRGYKN